MNLMPVEQRAEMGIYFLPLTYDAWLLGVWVVVVGWSACSDAFNIRP